MAKKLDLNGKIIGVWKVIKQEATKYTKSGKSKIYWLCQCEHGKTKIFNTWNLLRNKNINCGCYSKSFSNTRKPKFKIGDKFGFLQIINCVMCYRKRQYIYQYQCICGKKTFSTSTKIRSCGCDGKAWKGISGKYWCVIQSQAKIRKIIFDISIQKAWDLFINQKAKCALTGLKLKLSRNNRTASLDRIDSKKGYIEGNVQWVHKDINMMKLDFTEDEFIKYCKLVSIHFQE